MPYSLVSSATLGFDLVRLPAGRNLAGVLLTGLAADPGLLQRLADTHPAAVGTTGQFGRWSTRGRRLRELADAGVPRLQDAGDRAFGEGRAAALLVLLEQGMIGDAAAVERLVRADVLGPENAAFADSSPAVSELARDLFADAAIAWWAAPELSRADLRAATGPLDRAAPPEAGREPDLGPAGEGLADLFGRLRALDESGRGRWRAAVDAVRDDRRTWAAAMHGASWAAYLSGRTRSLASAQLTAVQAFVDAGFERSDGASGVWNALSGCVQALSVADLLDDEAMAVLIAPWHVATDGEPPSIR